MAETLKEFTEGQNQEQGTEKQGSILKSDEGKETVKELAKETTERDEKSWIAENKRKTEQIEKLQQEMEQLKQSAPQQQFPPQQPQVNWLDQVYTMAENEVATTGKAIPIQTIMQVAQSISQRNLETTFKNKDQADKAIRSFKRFARKDTDFAQMEDDFDELVDQLRPDQVNAPTLEVVLNSIRGKRLPDLIKKIKEQAREATEKDAEIIGKPTEKTAGGGQKPSSTLTPEQKAELDGMNSNNVMEWTEEEYINALKNKQNRFKAMGAKNTPQLMNDQMIK